MSALPLKTDTHGCRSNVRFGPRADIGQNRETASRRPLSKALQTLLSRRTGALRQPRARTKGEARVDLRSARSYLQRLIGNVQKYFLLPFLYDVRHDIDPFVCAPAYISARKFCPCGSQARPLRKIFNMVLLSPWTAEPAAR